MSQLLKQDLSIIEPKNVLALFSSDNGVDPLLAEVETLKASLLNDQDTSTAKGRDAIRADSRKFSTLKVQLESHAKGSIDEYNKILRAVNGNRRLVKESCDAARDEVRKALTQWEAKEKEFKDLVATTLSRINEAGKGLDVQQMEANRKYLDELTIDAETFRDEVEAIEKARTDKLEFVDQQIAVEVQRLADIQELEKLRAEKEQTEAKAKAEADKLAAEQAQAKREQDIKENAIREQQAAAERQQRESEQALQAERDKAEQQRSAAEAETKRLEHEKQQAVEAEKAKAKALADQQAKEKADREAKEREARAEEERLLANKRHIGNIRRQAKESLMLIDGVDEALAKKIVLAISKDKISKVSISYT